jgi:cytidine deaminase
MPCGACRQVIAEFAAEETPIAVDEVGTMTLSELLPHPFALERAGR